MEFFSSGLATHNRFISLNCNQHFGNFKPTVTTVSECVLFDEIVSAYFISEIYLYFSTGNDQPREPALCHTLSFDTDWSRPPEIARAPTDLGT